MKGARILSRTCGLVATLAMGITLGSCRAAHSEVRSVPDAWEAVPPGHSLIILTRPQAIGWAEGFLVVDDNGNFVAALPAQSRVHLIVPAGRYTFVGWGSKVMQDYLWASRVELQTAPNSAYFVFAQFRPDEGWQLILDPRMAPDERICDWEAEALAGRRIAPDHASGQAYLDREEVAEQIQDSREWLADQDTRRDLQVTGPRDGIPAAILNPKLRGNDPGNWCMAVEAARALMEEELRKRGAPPAQ